MRYNGCMNAFHYPTAAERKSRLETELPEIVRSIVECGGVKKIILFGSLAENRVGPDSDIDLFVIQETELRYLDRLDVALRRLDSFVALDLIIFTPTEVERAGSDPTGDLAQILTKGRVLYEA